MKKISLAVGMIALLGSTSCWRSCCELPEGVVEQRYVHKYGIEVPSQDWAERGKDGRVISTLGNGCKVCENYVHGQLHGECTYTFPHSETIERIDEYENGVIRREMIRDRGSRPQKEIVYLSPICQRITEWYEGGTPRSIEEYSDDLLVSGEYYSPKNQLESRVDEGNGLRTVRDRYGQQQRIETIAVGKPIIYTTYYPNGMLHEEMEVRENGVVHGTKKIFLPTGEPKTIETWHNGVQEGITTVFKEGIFFAEVPYVTGDRSGIEKRYNEHGDLVEEITWAKDLKHGPHHTYVQGVVQTQWYHKGRPVTKQTFHQLSRGENPLRRD